MSEANGLAPHTERATVSWCNGCLVHGSAPERVIFDARIQVSRSIDPPGPPRALLGFTLRPVIEAVAGLDGRKRMVQTFRMKWFDGSERFLCFCAACGDLAFADADDLAGWAVTGCRKCGIEMAAVGLQGSCLEGHTFGCCLRCPVSECDLPALSIPGFSGPEDRPAPPAGPSSSSHGPRDGPIDRLDVTG